MAKSVDVRKKPVDRLMPASEVRLLKKHPIAADYNQPDKEVFAAFKNDLEVNGQLVPIAICGNFILDGITRRRAGLAIHLETFMVREYFDLDELEIDALIRSLNDGRRHESARAQAARAAEYYFSMKGEKVTQYEAAKKFHISVRTLKREIARVKESLSGEISVKDQLKRAPKKRVPSEFVALANALPHIRMIRDSDVSYVNYDFIHAMLHEVQHFILSQPCMLDIARASDDEIMSRQTAG